MVKKSTSVQKEDREGRRIARRDRRREQAREEILDAAEEMLIRNGIGAVTVDAVAKEVALTKAALYYYFSSKDELLFEVMFRHLSAEAHAIHDAVEQTDDGAEALRAIIRTVIEHYQGNLHTYRLVYMHGQVDGSTAARLSPEMIARIRPLNAVMYAGAQQRLEGDRKQGLLPDETEPRRLAFVAHMAALGVLTMKGMVEDAGDPLIHGDESMIAELQQAFAKAARR
jgi:AcrR family transcriptional regulator